MVDLGYACINVELTGRNISVNRGMVKKTFNERGLNYVSEIAISNLNSLYEILKWNVENDVHFYRMSSDMFPWMSEYKFSQLPKYDEIKKLCKKIGKYAIENEIRLTFHPGPFNVLGSHKSYIISKTVDELNKHAEIMDMMGLSQSPYYKINIHVGGAYGDKKSAMERFCLNFKKLSDSAKKRLTVENDDRCNLFNTTDLYNGIYKKIKIPIVFDYLHYECNPDETDIETTLMLALSTWPTDVKPAVHYSSSKKIEDEKAIARSHANYVYESINLYSNDIDVMLESKMKELAVLDYRNSF